MTDTIRPSVGVILGSASDLDKIKSVFQEFDRFEVTYEAAVISAHRTPELLAEYARTAHSRGIKVILAAAGLSAALPGALAAAVDIPVIGIPVAVGPLNGMDALLAIAQMPPGVPVGAVGIDAARNAALLAIRILALSDNKLMAKLTAYRKSMGEDTLKKTSLLNEQGIRTWERLP